MSDEDSYEQYLEQVAQDRADEQAYLASQEAKALEQAELEYLQQKQQAAQLLGKLGGASKSAAKQAASRANGAKHKPKKQHRKKVVDKSPRLVDTPRS